MKVKLFSNITADNGATLSEGSVVDLPDEQVEQLIKVGAAELSDDNVTEVVETPAPQTEVEPATNPLPALEPAGPPAPSQAPTAVQPPDATIQQEASTQDTPASSETTSPNLHLG